MDDVIAACGGRERAAIRALLIANEFVSGELGERELLGWSGASTPLVS